jgi:hypothetical protein
MKSISPPLLATKFYLPLPAPERVPRLRLIEAVDCHPLYRFLGVTKARSMPYAQVRAYLERIGQVAQAREWG